MRALRLVVVAALTAAALTAVLPAVAPALEVGQKAPDFTLPGSGNKPVKLSELTAKGPAAAQVVGVSADHAQMLPQYGALETNEASPIYRYAKRAYFVIDRDGVVRYEKVQANPLDLLDPDEVLKAVKESGVK